MHVKELRLFRAMHSLYSNNLYRAPDVAAVGTIFNIFSYDALSDRDSNLSPSRQRADALHVTQQSQGIKQDLLKLSTNKGHFGLRG